MEPENTNLEGAILSMADLRDCNFSNANLSNAMMEGANIEGINLKGAILQGLRIDEKQAKILEDMGIVNNEKYSFQIIKHQ